MADEPVTWSIGRQYHASRPNQGGPPETGVNVPVVLSTGETFEIFVSDDTYSDPQAVKQAVQSAVDHHVTVARLTGKA